MNAHAKQNEHFKSPETGSEFEALLYEVTALENLAAALNTSTGEELLKAALSGSPDKKSKD